MKILTEKGDNFNIAVGIIIGIGLLIYEHYEGEISFQNKFIFILISGFVINVIRLIIIHLRDEINKFDEDEN